MANEPEQNNLAYTEASIQHLSGLEAVRRRPGMYVGGTDLKALHHLVYEVVDNSIDEALAGTCTDIAVTIHKNGAVSVIDNGRGIPVGMHPTEKISTLQLVMTELNAGGKFGGGGYKVSGGLHGVGVSAVNALSVALEADVRRDGYLWRQRYQRGNPLSEVEKIGKSQDTGTTIHFLPDPEIFPDTEFKFDTLTNRFREMAFVTRGISIHLRDERAEPFPHEMSFYFEGGIRSFVRYLNRNRKALHDVVYGNQVFEVEELHGAKIEIEIAIQYADYYSESLLAFANTIHTPDGGTHLEGVRAAVTRAINFYAKKAGVLKESDPSFTGEDTYEGLTAIVSIKHPEPQFESQTKVKLLNPEVKGLVQTLVTQAFGEFLQSDTRAAKIIYEKCLVSSRARVASKRARDLIRSSPLQSTTLPGKLADCSSTDPTQSEIYIVEGDSAGGCFDGETLVALADGRAISFKEIVAEQAQGREHFCYTIRHNGTVGLERIASARRTQQNADVVRVTLDNSETLICTPDHRFMMRNGEYRPAEQLTPGDSLMPLYRKLSDTSQPGITIDGYEMVWNPRSATWLFTHKLADWHNRWQEVYSKVDGDHCHHIDFNKLNNNPTNIRRLPADEHLALHRAHIEQTLHRPEAIAKWRVTRQSSAFRQKMSQLMLRPTTRAKLSKNAKAQWRDQSYKAFMAHRWRVFYESNEAYRQQNADQLNKAQIAYWGEQSNRDAQSERTSQYYVQHPEARDARSTFAQRQWTDQALLEWRREKTREQWTPEFRQKRLTTLAETYYRKTITALRGFMTPENEIDTNAYQSHRRITRDKSLLRFDSFCKRYFGGDVQQASEAVHNYNHRVVSVERLSEHVDVYDIEVPRTHNFALASGVFVHNSAKQGRDRHFQAILPLRGKILNTERARLDKILDNKEVQALIAALGVGISDEFDLSRLRYGRVIIMTDADVDGAHIRTLLLTFFFRFMPSLIKEGHLYIAQPPLYLVKSHKKQLYAYSDAQKDGYVKDFGGNAEIQRYKGLGEMNPQQLWDTTMNPEVRTLLQVTIEDAGAADRTFDMLMGANVPPRRAFIQTHAKSVRNLDI